MRFDNLHWTPIDAPAKGLTFKELNSESTEQKPVLEKTDNQENESKAQILESTLIQAVLTMMRNKNKVVSEAT